MPIDLGNNVRLQAECRDANDTLVNAITAALTITLPDGTTATPAVTNPPADVGVYVVDYVPVQPGRHGVRWTCTDPASAYTDVFDVREAAPPFLFSLADAKAHLNITGASEDEELRSFIEATTRAVEYFTGPVVRRTVTEIAQGGRDRVLLAQTPVLSVTSVAGVELGQLEVPVDALDVDAVSGVVRRTDGLPFWPGPYRWVYEAGRLVVTANISLAAKIILQHLWRTQHGGSRGPVFGGGDDFSVTEPIPGLGYAIPNRALQLLQADREPPGVA